MVIELKVIPSGTARVVLLEADKEKGLRDCTSGDVLLALLNLPEGEWINKPLIDLGFTYDDTKRWLEGYIPRHDAPEDYEDLLRRAERVTQLRGDTRMNGFDLSIGVFACASPLMDALLEVQQLERYDVMVKLRAPEEFIEKFV